MDKIGRARPLNSFLLWPGKTSEGFPGTFIDASGGLRCFRIATGDA